MPVVVVSIRITIEFLETAFLANKMHHENQSKDIYTFLTYRKKKMLISTFSRSIEKKTVQPFSFNLTIVRSTWQLVAQNELIHFHRNWMRKVDKKEFISLLYAHLSIVWLRSSSCVRVCCSKTVWFIYVCDTHIVTAFMHDIPI